MKLRILLGALLLLIFTSDAANAQRYHRGGYRGHGYYGGPRYRRGPAVVVVPPRPVIVRHGYYGPRYRRGYAYGPRYHRGYNRGYRRGYYSGRRGYHHRRW